MSRRLRGSRYAAFAAGWLGLGAAAFGQYGMSRPSVPPSRDGGRANTDADFWRGLGEQLGNAIREGERQRRQPDPVPRDFIPDFDNNRPRPPHVPRQPQYIPQQPQYIPQQPQYIPQQPQAVIPSNVLPSNRLPANALPSNPLPSNPGGYVPRPAVPVQKNQLALTGASVADVREKLAEKQDQALGGLTDDLDAMFDGRLSKKGRKDLADAVAETAETGDTSKFDEQIAAAKAAGDTKLAAALEGRKRLAETQYEIDNDQIDPAGVRDAMADVRKDLKKGFPPGQKLDGVLDQVDGVSDLSNAVAQLDDLDADSDDGLDALNGLGDSVDPGVVVILSDTLGLPIVPGADALGDTTAPEGGGEVGDSGGIVLLNPEETGGTIAYRVGDEDFSTEAGSWQEVNPVPAGTWVVSFDRGGGFGTARYTLTPGTYAFRLTDRGWDLAAKKPFTIVIDNSAFAGDFRYVVDGRSFVVRAGKKGQHTSRYPMTVQFDRGDGGEAARKELLSGTYKVAVDLAERRLDLFEIDGSALASAGEAPAPRSE